MPELTLDQNKALALARARRRRAEGQAPPEQAQPASTEPQANAPREGRFSDAMWQGMTLGYGDEIDAGIGAGVDALKGLVTGEGPSIGEAYDERLKGARATLEQYRADNPIKSTVAEIGGAMIPTMATGGAAVPATLAQAGKAAVTGAGVGGVYGFGAGEGGFEERRNNAGLSGFVGGVAGGAVPYVGRALAKRASTKMAPKVEAIKKYADSLYANARKSNHVIVPQAYERIVRDLVQTAQSEGARRKSANITFSALDDLVDELGTGKSFQDMDELRQVLKIGAGNSKGKERYLTQKLVARFDDHLENLNPQDVAGKNPEAVTRTYRQARKMYTKFKKAEVLEEAIKRAGRRASQSGSGGNIENALRSQFTRIVESPKLSRGFGKDEIQAMEDIIAGGNWQNFMRKLGKMSPNGNGLVLNLYGMLGLGAAGAAAAGAPMAGAAIPFLAAGAAVGAGSKAIADRIPQVAAKRLLADVSRGHKAVPMLNYSGRHPLAVGAGASGLLNTMDGPGLFNR